ncbi:unnamed protein product [Vitrella brassicaformis CCMP3155]|uniref:Uncharacterized protein n=2 Tax=Vitrella brassicaformis TaxID=1169539 RepID=A0A0G4ERC8_VITBC|nr:unnamed protein product [Vitrella brassicaformis CCMP3155]|mmetsp:Transcript_48254/g.120805  ORF Transcript_48254/g.120805 Transcript_48254/m.120805 type:complete len:194 (+) Transcript_48254:829-1410(+)|eukprot:CEM00823.1 unnamed protein product [Vitrella brassicaformis CCMP3155]
MWSYSDGECNHASALELIAYLSHSAGRNFVKRALYSSACSERSPPVVLRLVLRKGASIRAALSGWLCRGDFRNRLLAAYCEYLRYDLPVQVSIAVKTAILHTRALTSTKLPDGVTDIIAALIGVSRVSIPIGEQRVSNRINDLVNGYVSSAYECIRQTGGSLEGMGGRLDDLMQQVREATKVECCRFCPWPYI